MVMVILMMWWSSLQSLPSRCHPTFARSPTSSFTAGHNFYDVHVLLIMVMIIMMRRPSKLCQVSLSFSGTYHWNFQEFCALQEHAKAGDWLHCFCDEPLLFGENYHFVCCHMSSVFWSRGEQFLRYFFFSGNSTSYDRIISWPEINWLVIGGFLWCPSDTRLPPFLPTNSALKVSSALQISNRCHLQIFQIPPLIVIIL